MRSRWNKSLYVVGVMYSTWFHLCHVIFQQTISVVMYSSSELFQLYDVMDVVCVITIMDVMFV
jgi:hypothetical protein